MDDTILAEIIGGAFGIVTGIITAVITGKYTVKAARKVPESNQPKEILSKGNSAHKNQWRQALAAITIGVIVFFILQIRGKNHRL